MTPLDRVPDQRPVPAGTGLTLEDAFPAPVTADVDGASARPRLARTVAEMRSALRELVAHATDDGDAEPVTVGLIPTMGALHGGHAALVRRARAENDVVAVSIFVNPLQFGDPADLEHYPRTLDADLDLLAAAGADVVFAPDVQEMYPGYPDAPIVTVSAGRMGEVLEGASRPGHFDGVLTVVLKLLHLTRPDVAVFGSKDAQQLMAVRRMVRDLCLGIEVVGVETVREPDGLALSSRNRYLTPFDREVALVLQKALTAGAAAATAVAETPNSSSSALMRSESSRTCCERWEVLFLMKCASSTTIPRKPKSPIHPT